MTCALVLFVQPLVELPVQSGNALNQLSFATSCSVQRQLRGRLAKFKKIRRRRVLNFRMVHHNVDHLVTFPTAAKVMAEWQDPLPIGRGWSFRSRPLRRTPASAGSSAARARRLSRGVQKTAGVCCTPWHHESDETYETLNSSTYVNHTAEMHRRHEAPRSLLATVQPTEWLLTANTILGYIPVGRWKGNCSTEVSLLSWWQRRIAQEPFHISVVQILKVVNDGTGPWSHQSLPLQHGDPGSLPRSTDHGSETHQDHFGKNLK